MQAKGIVSAGVERAYFRLGQWKLLLWEEGDLEATILYWAKENQKWNDQCFKWAQSEEK